MPTPPIPFLILSLTLASPAAVALPLQASALDRHLTLAAAPTAASGRAPDVLVVRHSFVWDGMPVSCRVLACGDLQLRLPWEVFDAWNLAGDSQRGGLSGSVDGPLPVDLRVALMPGEDSGARLSTDEWHAYLRRTTPGTEGDITVLGDDDSRQNPAMLSLLGGRTRLAWIEYMEKGHLRQALHAAVALPDGLVVFTLSGSPDAVRRAQPRFAGLLTAVEIAPK